MSSSSPSSENHHIVAIEAIHCPIPEFKTPKPHTREIHTWTTPKELPARVQDATIIITTTIRLNASILAVSATPKLRLIVILASGTDCVDKEAARVRGIPVCNCPGTNIDSVSEHAIGLYFAVRRKFVQMTNVTLHSGSSETEWKREGSLRGMIRGRDGRAPLLCSQEVMGIIGYGALGRRIHGIAQGLGMEVLVAERRGHGTGNESVREDRVLFEEVLRRASVLVLCLPRTPETEKLISTEEFKVMRPEAVLINVARGGIVDEEALVEALREGQIWGAGLDVFEKEPVGRGESPLLEDRAKGLNIVASPHLAWYAEKTLENLQSGVKRTVEEWCVGNTINRVA